MDIELDLLIRQLGPAGGFSFVKAMPEPSTWRVGIDSVTVELAADLPRRVLVMCAGLGSPVDASDCDDLRDLFTHYAALWQCADGARIGTLAPDGELVLLQDVGLKWPDVSALVDLLREFVAKCLAWRRIVSGEAKGEQDAFAPDPLPESPVFA